jgi:protein TonB
VKKTIPKPTPTPNPKPEPKPKPKPEPKPEPKWKPTPVDQIKKGKKVEPVKPAVSAEEIANSLKNIQQPSVVSSTKAPVGPIGNPNADAAYIAQIGNFFDQRWTKPASSAPAASAVVRIYISKWGTITRRTKIQGSGDSEFDASAMSAVNSVDKVPAPPSGFPYDYVEVEFRVRN